jgi:hypothetical protein
VVLPDGEPVGTVNVPLIEPGVEIEQVLPGMSVGGEPKKIWHPLSVKLKLVPVTATDVPMGPAESESVTDVVVTVKGTGIDACCTIVELCMVTVCVT